MIKQITSHLTQSAKHRSIEISIKIAVVNSRQKSVYRTNQVNHKIRTWKTFQDEINKKVVQSHWGGSFSFFPKSLDFWMTIFYVTFRFFQPSFTQWPAVQRTSLTATDASSAACSRRWPDGTVTVPSTRRWLILPVLHSCQIDVVELFINVIQAGSKSVSSYCVLTGVCELPRLPDHLQSHWLRRREQSRSAGLWEL